jgi:hypothetical protein
MLWFKSKGKKPVGIDPTNPSAADIIANAYAKVLDQGKKHPMFRPVSVLPYSKEQIATALMTDSLSMRDPEFTRAAGVCYVYLAGFLSEEDAAIAAKVDSCSEELRKDAGNQLPGTEYARLCERHAEIMQMFSEELKRLNREWQSFSERNGLVDPEDPIPGSLVDRKSVV